jgi:hypothetical protein
MADLDRFVEYEVMFTVRCGRRVAQRARNREAQEIGVKVLDALAGVGVTLAQDARIRVRRLP